MGQLDTRILSLYSRDSRKEKFSRLDDSQYYSFCYYDAIEVRKAKFKSEGACHSLLSAYEAAVAMGEKLYASRQFLLAFADIQENESSHKSFCYTKQEIDRFWEEDGMPLFFVTMVNLRDNRYLDSAFSEISRIFSGEQYLVYLTFDHCDLLMFCRGDSFKTYADKIFQLNYGTSLVEDSITLYSFNDCCTVESGEWFDVYLRFGVRDYIAADNFLKYYRKQGANVGRLLGRNDIGLLKKDADMPWLKELIDKTLTSSERWYTTYEISVLIRIPDTSSWEPVLSDSLNLSKDNIDESKVKIGDVMDTALNKFLEAYGSGTLGVPEDPVWIHWLQKSSALATSLYENRLAMDFGTCLVPQFLDLFSYVTKLLRNGLSPANTESVLEIFSAFFSSTSILMDSINHSSRQFVQVPSFGSVSFEMPPKLMAYYTAMAHRLIEVFRDEEITYGIAFCPEFARTLKVTSYANQDISKDEWLTISIDERSLYTLKLTSETLGHEISHFVGEHNRCRDVREKFAIQTGLAGLGTVVLCQLRKRLADSCNADSPFKVTVEWSDVYSLVNEMMEDLENTYLPEWAGEKRYSRNLQNRLANLPGVVLCVPDLANSLEMWLCRHLLEDKWAIMRELEKYFARKIGGPEATPQKTSKSVYHAMAKELIHVQMIEALEDLAADNRLIESGALSPMYNSNAQASSPDWICYMFSEAFADLQMILLFNLSWNDYQILLMQDETQLSAGDRPPRMLAVAKALVDMGKWQRNSIQTSGYTGTDKSFHYIAHAVTLNLALDETSDAFKDAVDNDARQLQGMGFETDIVFFLSEYLKVCYNKIHNALMRKEKKGLVSELRTMHELLSKMPSVYDLEMQLIEFINNYRSDLKRLN